MDRVWDNRPPRPTQPVFVLSTEFAGKCFKEKLQHLKEDLKRKNQAGVVLSALDEIAWLLNLRGSDIAFNPVFFAYLVVTLDNTILYINPAQLSEKEYQHLEGVVEVKNYDSFFEDLSQQAENLINNSQRILVPNRASWAIEKTLGKDHIVVARSPVMSAKSIKNETELEGMRKCHLRDAAALCEFFGWLELQVNEGNDTLTEVSVADHLEKLRSKNKHFKGLSFDTISGFGANSAVIHYKPENETCAKITSEHIYLCDSGAQYLDGTTDVTRTLHFGQPTDRERACFTKVLQGHIGLDQAIFPSGTTGYTLDVIARLPLWKAGLDYRHGTGHGVGSFLNVHEGPHGIGFRRTFNDAPLEPGMTVTNEPGYYEVENNFGIRIENILLVRQMELENRFGGIDYLGFEHVTLVPLQHKLMDLSLLSKSEIEWINAYHQECLEKVGPYLESGSLGHQWLTKSTQKIG